MMRNIISSEARLTVKALILVVYTSVCSFSSVSSSNRFNEIHIQSGDGTRLQSGAKQTYKKT